LYEFLSQRGEHHPDGSEVFVGMAEGQNPAALIVDAALQSTDLSTNSHATLGLFISILGAEAGNLALKVLATGGIYLGGSILPGMRSLVSTGQFMQALQSKGRSSRLLGRIPVYLVVNAKAPLLGAAYFGLAEGGPGRG
jgi:glucokinase